ncbi:uncharacterized protein F4812DRAFT_430029 [Daldinia caldariorum]|uniref:uncharacterized protein n=1 Tax=Daldinia caldariorum TaxID=326644 RepID=UPI0020077C29|nr:uncharacterized protein F4812DRAFT_430029 [Daldinia caldariorum]KAI1467571.1 hypothetical protein F4812DRAFT_430029 [Daldinia caldariorum]
MGWLFFTLLFFFCSYLPPKVGMIPSTSILSGQALLLSTYVRGFYKQLSIPELGWQRSFNCALFWLLLVMRGQYAHVDVFATFIPYV